MAKAKLKLNPEFNSNSDKFIKKINSEMHYKSNLNNDLMNFEWLEEIDFAIIYLDNIVRRPKVVLIKEEDIVKVEKAKKTSVATVKNLARNTRNIETVDEVTNDVIPSKLLIERSEETFNIYENRFIYTLITNLSKFVAKKKKELDDIEINDDKVLEYIATTETMQEKINIELKISANEFPKDLNPNKKMQEKLDEARKKMVRVEQFIMSWQNSEMMKTLTKLKVPLVIPPIKKTNIILKNPNFQVAVKLWNYLQAFSDEDHKEDGIDTSGDNVLRGLLDDAFLMNYFVLDSISSSKREQKAKLKDYAVVMIHQQIKRVIAMLLASGIKMSDQDILDLILKELKSEKDKSAIDGTDVKNKFKSAFEEYLDKTKEYL